MTETTTAARSSAGDAELLGVLRAAGEDLERTAAVLRGMQDAAPVENPVLTLRAQAALVVAGQVQELAAQVREIAEWERSKEEALPPVRLSSQASRIAARLRILAEGVESIERAAKIGMSLYVKRGVQRMERPPDGGAGAGDAPERRPRERSRRGG